MKGRVLDYDTTAREGIISGDDGNRYRFVITEWKGAVLPKPGMESDFSGIEGVATAIYPLSASSAEGSKKIPAALLAFFLGGLGIHKFYLGYKTEGVIMLLVFVFGWLFFGIPSVIVSVIAFIEFIVYLIKSDEEFERTYVTGRRGWF